MVHCVGRHKQFRCGHGAPKNGYGREYSADGAPVQNKVQQRGLMKLIDYARHMRSTRNLLNGNEYINARQHDHRQQTVAEHRDDGANGHGGRGGHQREQRIKSQRSQYADAIDVGKGDFAALILQ